VEKTIGFGCSANIYLVSDKETKEKFAMKVFKEGSEKDAENEISLYKQLKNHSNIVSYRDSFKFDDGSGTICYALVVEYCNEGDLSKKAFKKLKLTKSQLTNIMLETLQGMIHVHDLHYTHCDIKPANIFKSDGVTKVADFGFTIPNSQTIIGGTTEYMSKEHFQLETTADYFIDVWSLGCFFLELMTKKSHDMKIQISKEEDFQDFWKKQKLNEEFDDDYMKVLSCCFKFNPQERPTVKELLISLLYLQNKII
jgi:serine/threonine protein kinase